MVIEEESNRTLLVAANGIKLVCRGFDGNTYDVKSRASGHRYSVGR